MFDSEAKHTCLMNADGASSETYMKLGNLVSSSEAFMDNGKCRFSLVYDDTMVMEWKQTSWPTSSSSTGSGCVFPTESGPSSSPGCSRFEGIAVSHSQNSVLDGNGDSSCWYHAIGASSDCKGGFPGRNSQIAYSMKFFIRTTETPTPMPTPLSPQRRRHRRNQRTSTVRGTPSLATSSPNRWGVHCSIPRPSTRA